MTDNADTVRPELLAEWLLVNGFAEKERGYGHVSAEDLAEALLERYEIQLRHNAAEYERHVQVNTPNWDTKVRCSCGAEFISRCEFWKHGYEALLTLLEDGDE